MLLVFNSRLSAISPVSECLYNSATALTLSVVWLCLFVKASAQVLILFTFVHAAVDFHLTQWAALQSSFGLSTQSALCSCQICCVFCLLFLCNLIDPSSSLGLVPAECFSQRASVHVGWFGYGGTQLCVINNEMTDWFQSSVISLSRFIFLSSYCVTLYILPLRTCVSSNASSLTSCCLKFPLSYMWLCKQLPHLQLELVSSACVCTGI